jgi:hypothetical protein
MTLSPSSSESRIGGIPSSAAKWRGATTEGPQVIAEVASLAADASLLAAGVAHFPWELPHRLRESPRRQSAPSLGPLASPPAWKRSAEGPASFSAGRT